MKGHCSAGSEASSIKDLQERIKSTNLSKKPSPQKKKPSKARPSSGLMESLP